MRTILTIVVLTGFIFSGDAKDRPMITLRVAVKEKNLIEHYPTVKQIEESLAEGLAVILNDNLPVFYFETSVAADDTLYVSIARSYKSSIFIDVDFVVKVSGKNVWPSFRVDSIQWEFAKEATFSDFLKDNPADFVALALSQFITVFRLEEIVSEQLQSLVIPQSVYQDKPDFDDKSWRLAYTHGELKLGFDSQLRILHEYEVPEVITRKFLGEVKTRKQAERILVMPVLPVPIGFDAVTEFRQDKFAHVIGIQILRFRPFSAAAPATPVSFANR